MALYPKHEALRWLRRLARGHIKIGEDFRGLAKTAVHYMEDGMSVLNPANILKYNIEPALQFLGTLDIEPTDEARVETLAIAGQESNWEARLQVGGPARSLWQFEHGGGVDGVFRLCGPQVEAVCDALAIPYDDDTVFEAMAWNNVLGAAMARLLLWTDPKPLPALGDVDGAWNYYLNIWRPGAPHPETWPEKYQTALNTVQGNATA